MSSFLIEIFRRKKRLSLIHILKIDTNFLVMNGENEHRGIDILRSVIQLADKMQIAVIAEGVETREQIELLRKMGCVYGQGYYYYRPVSYTHLKRRCLAAAEKEIFFLASVF